MIGNWWLMVERTQALVDGESSSEALRHRAATTRDLLELLATWPVPRRAGFREDLASSLFGLCEKSGEALCGGRHCPTGFRSSEGASCRIVREQPA